MPPDKNVVPDNIGAALSEFMAQAQRLGITWSMRLATVTGDITFIQTATSTRIVLDGDDARITANSLIGRLAGTTRVFVLFVPPAGAYIIGRLDAGNATQPYTIKNLTVDGLLTIAPPASSGSKAIQFNEGYSIFVDNVGAGTDASRMWIDGPDGGEIILGPRTAANLFHSIRLRTNDTTASAANMHLSANHTVFLSTSSARFKEDITPYTYDTDKLWKLQPVKFHDKKEKQKDPDNVQWYYGLTAEQVHEVGLDEVVVMRDDVPHSIEYSRIVLPLLQAVKELRDEVAQLKKQINDA